MATLIFDDTDLYIFGHNQVSGQADLYLLGPPGIVREFFDFEDAEIEVDADPYNFGGNFGSSATIVTSPSPPYGTYTLKISQEKVEAYFRSPLFTYTSGTKMISACYIRFQDPPTGFPLGNKVDPFVAAVDETGSTYWTVILETNGTLELRDASGTLIGLNTSFKTQPDIWHRLEVVWEPGKITSNWAWYLQKPTFESIEQPSITTADFITGASRTDVGLYFGGQGGLILAAPIDVFHGGAYMMENVTDINDRIGKTEGKKGDWISIGTGGKSHKDSYTPDCNEVGDPPIPADDLDSSEGKWSAIGDNDLGTRAVYLRATLSPFIGGAVRVDAPRSNKFDKIYANKWIWHGITTYSNGFRAVYGKYNYNGFYDVTSETADSLTSTLRYYRHIENSVGGKSPNINELFVIGMYNTAAFGRSTARTYTNETWCYSLHSVPRTFIPDINDSVTLYISAGLHKNDTPLYLEGFSLESGNVPLFIHGHDFITSSGSPISGMIQPENLVLYHPCDSYVDSFGNTWVREVFLTGLFDIEDGQIDNAIGFTGNTNTDMAIFNTYGHNAGVNRITTVFWASGLSETTPPQFIGLGPINTSPPMNNSLAIRSDGNAFLILRSDPLVFLVWSGVVPTTGDWRFHALDFERDPSSGTWTLRHSEDGGPWITEASQTGIGFVGAPTPYFYLELKDLENDGVRVDDIGYWRDATLFTSEELQSLYDLGASHIALDQYSYNPPGYDLFIHGLSISSGQVPLFVAGFDTTSGNTPLHIDGHISHSGDMSLYINGHIGSSDDVDLFLHGSSSLSGQIPLFINGHIGLSGSGDLFIHGFSDASGQISLYIEGHDTVATSGDLFIHAFDSTSGNTTLYINGLIPHSGNTSIYIEGHVKSSGSSDLFIHGLSKSSEQIPLFMHGKASASGQVPLFVDGHIELSDQTDLFLHGSISSSGQATLFIHGKSPASGQSSLFINGHILSSGDISLFIGGFNSSSDTTTLFIHGSTPVSSSVDFHIGGSISVISSGSLYISGSGIIFQTGTVSLLINGLLPIQPVVCPILDPTASIQISDTMISVYQNSIDALINQLGKNTTLIFQPQISLCPNCLYDNHRQRSTGVYKIGGPRPFSRGRQCPYCKGKGILETESAKCIKCLIKWRPKEIENYDISVNDIENIVRLKTYIVHIDDLMKAEKAIVLRDTIDMSNLTVVRIGNPIPVGLREDRYCISFWELL